MVFPGKKTTPFVGIYNELKNVTRACETKFKGLENYRYCFVFV
jgi:hypothetical protein